MKRRDVEQHLRSHGCQFHHHGGLHDVWTNPYTGRSASVPRYDEIKTGLAPGICRNCASRLRLGGDENGSRRGKAANDIPYGACGSRMGGSCYRG